jgi:perosamine synthetase
MINEKKLLTTKILKLLNKTVSKKKNLHSPFFDKDEDKFVLSCLKSTYVSSHGNFTNYFEEKIKKLTKSKNVIAVSSGTAALHLSLIGLGVEKNNEVLVSPITFVATVNVIKYCNAIPHFVDVSSKTGCIDPKILNDYLLKTTIIHKKKCYNKNSKRLIKSLIVTHVLGHSAEIFKIKEICKKFKIHLVEDAAEAIGSYHNKKHLGTFGDIGVISFNGNKTITCGGGGVLLCSSLSLFKKIKHISQQSKKKHKWEFLHDQVGYNYRMPSLNAALGLGQLKKLKLILKSKKNFFLKYQKNCKDIKDIKILDEPYNSKSNFWLNAIIIKKNDIKLRDLILKVTNNKGFQTRPLWKPLHKFSYLKNCPRSTLKNAESFYNRVICLPSSPSL